MSYTLSKSQVIAHTRQYASCISVGMSTMPDKKYTVSYDYPFKVSKVNQKDNIYFYFDSFSHIHDAYFSNRFDAEVFSIKQQIEFLNSKTKLYNKQISNFHNRKKVTAGFNGPNYNINQINMRVKKLKLKYRLLEEEHPEWLI